MNRHVTFKDDPELEAALLEQRRLHFLHQHENYAELPIDHPYVQACHRYLDLLEVWRNK